MQRERRAGEKLGRIGTDWQALAISVLLIARNKTGELEQQLETTLASHSGCLEATWLEDR
jgi:hypothetical protein